MFNRLGTTELILILGIALVVFGPSKLPEIGKSLGKAINEFKKNSNGQEDKNAGETKDEDEKEQ